MLYSPAQAGESVPINATFGIEWTPVNWSTPLNRISETRGAAGLPNGRSIGIATRGRSSAATGLANSEYVDLRFSATDWVYAQYVDMPVTFDPVTNTASFDGPLTVIGGAVRRCQRHTEDSSPDPVWRSVGRHDRHQRRD